MSMISEQVKELRELARKIKKYGTTEELKSYKVIAEAAGTIEALSAKLQVANEELERWHTDHINKKIKNPFAWTSTLICQNCDHKDEYIEELEAEVEELKAANMENGGGWIACEDRLPEEHKLYDITFENSVGTHSDSAIYNPYLGMWLWNADETELVENKVLAWAEKRKPYHQ